MVGLTNQFRYSADLPEQGEPRIGEELIQVRHGDGRTEELRLHDYGRLYSIPGLYERIVHERLGCRSPAQIASMLGEAVDRIAWERGAVRVIDLAAGNGISGAALAAQGLRPVLGTDIVTTARAAALRDRPHVYDAYRTLDLLDLDPTEEQAIADLRANALTCVAPVGTASQQLPPLAVTAVARLLAPDALIAYMHDPRLGVSDELEPALIRGQLGDGIGIEQLDRRRYLHRYTVSGRPYEMDGVVLRVRRG